jgi:antitoxin (DNA-binding transcriptional repressor) of toxin-antitoxin stability system
MNKMVGAAEFKVHCLRIIAEAERTGETIIITKRGKPIMELKPIQPKERKPLFGLLRHPEYRFSDPDAPAYDQPWNAELGILGDED